MTPNVSTDGIERVAPPRTYPILYVDDEPENILVFRAVFSDEFQVLTAQSAGEALEVLAEAPVAVLVADQRMPHVTGIELCEEAARRLPAVRRMLLTAYSDHQTAIDAINRGRVHAYLEKPWDPVRMRQALWEAVNRVHLDRTVVDLRNRLAERELQFEHARMRERILHDIANATSRLTLSTFALRKLVENRGAELPDDLRDKLAHESEAFQRATEHLVKLQKEQRASSKPGDLRPERLPLDEVLRTLDVLAAFPPASGLRLRLHSDDGLVAFVDRLGLTRILVNLVRNAQQAIEGQEMDHGEVSVTARADGEQVLVEVTDTGPGITEPMRSRVFDEYFTTKERTGTGIGLATARDIAQASGGTLELPDDQPPRGALFRLTLPRASAPRQDSDRASPGDAAHV